MATQTDVARHLFISQQRVAQLIEKRVLPAADRGEHDIDACREAYIQHLQEMASGNDEALAKARTRLAEEQADAASLANAERRRDLLPRAAVTVIWRDIIAEAKAKLLAIPTRIAPQLANLKKPAAIKERLTEVIHESLAELSQPRALPAGLAGDSERSASVVGAATQADDQRVGGSVSAAKSRGKRRAG